MISLGKGIEEFVQNPTAYDLCLNRNNTLTAEKKYRYGWMNRFRRWLFSSCRFDTIVKRLSESNLKVQKGVENERLFEGLKERLLEK